MFKQVVVALRKVIIRTHHRRNFPLRVRSSWVLTLPIKVGCAFSARALSNA